MIEAEKATYNVCRMAQLLGVSRSGYYAWVKRQDAPLEPRAVRRADLTVKIKAAHDASDGVNGAPRILADLREAGEVVSPRRWPRSCGRTISAGSAPGPGAR